MSRSRFRSKVVRLDRDPPCEREIAKKRWKARSRQLLRAGHYDQLPIPLKTNGGWFW